MGFQKGQSGNPAGRPPGSRNRAAMLLQNLLERDAERIARKAIDLAKAGDIAAIRMCMDRLVPTRKSDSIVFELPPLARPPIPSRRRLRSRPRWRLASSRRRRRRISRR
jgi:hypothetical protein